MPPLRRAFRLRATVSRFPAGRLPGPGCPARAEAPHPARAVRRVKWLTPDGVVAALGVGFLVTWRFSWPGLALLGACFLSGSLLSQCAERRAPRRNARQVIANGGGAGPAARPGAWPPAAGALRPPPAHPSATQRRAPSAIPPRARWSRVRLAARRSRLFRWLSPVL